MNDHLNFETFLSLSPKKFVISSYSILNKNLYEKELNFENKSKKLDLKTLDHFLNENVFKIENTATFSNENSLPKMIVGK